MSYFCPFCDKPCAKKFGLRNHLKSCKKKPADARVHEAYDEAVRLAEKMDVDEYEEEEEVIVDIIIDDEEEDDIDTDYPSHSKGTNMSTDRNPISADRASSSRQGPFDIGAFLVMTDHIPLLIDVNFAIALGEHILDTGSDNKAIMAFAHKLKKLADD